MDRSSTRSPAPSPSIVFLALLAAGLWYGTQGLLDDIQSVHETLRSGVFGLLGVALLIALGFEFVNGFHDTANAVATVIYTHSMAPVVAVVWSGVFNFLGVMVSTGAVAYGIITLLPVELILQVGSGAGYAMIFALLIAAIVWNLGTWAIGIPNSSSHALIGSIMGVGIANQLMAPAGQATSGVDWDQALNVAQALLFSPLMGFVFSAAAAAGDEIPHPRAEALRGAQKRRAAALVDSRILIFTCTGVSFAHGGNDGQKGMGLIMLILIGAAPTAYALNRTMPDSADARLRPVGDGRAERLRGPCRRQPAGDAGRGARHRRRRAARQEAQPARRFLPASRSCRATSRSNVQQLRRDRPCAGSGDAQSSQRHVFDGRCDPPAAESRARNSPRAETATLKDYTDGLADRHALHSAMGQGLRRDRAGPGHDGGLEAHRGHGRRAYRQDPPDLCAGRRGRNGRGAHHRRGGALRPAGFDHAYSVERRGRNDGGERLGPAMEHGPLDRHGLGADPSRRNGLAGGLYFSSPAGIGIKAKGPRQRRRKREVAALRNKFG